MYDDTAEIRSMEGEWMDRKRRESSNSQGTLGAWVIKKTKKGDLAILFSCQMSWQKWCWKWTSKKT